MAHAARRSDSVVSGSQMRWLAGKPEDGGWFEGEGVLVSGNADSMRGDFLEPVGNGFGLDFPFGMPGIGGDDEESGGLEDFACGIEGG